MLIPLHFDAAADPARRGAVVGGFDLDTAVQVYGALAELIEAERLDGQLDQGRLLLGKHGRHLALGGAVNARVGPVLFPAVEIGLGFCEAFETQAFQRSVLGVADAALDLAFSIWISHPAGQGHRAVMGQQVAVQRVERRIIDIGPEDALAEVVEDHCAGDAAQAAKGAFVEFGPDVRAGVKGEQPYGLAAPAQGEHKHPRAAVAAAVWIADHRPAAVVDLGLLTGGRDDDGAGLAGRAAAQLADEAFDALVASTEAVIVDQILHGLGVSALAE